VRGVLPHLPSIPLVPVAAVLVLLASSMAVVAGARNARARRRRAWADVMLERLERAGARYGRSRRAWETPASYADTLARSVLPDPRVRSVADTLERDAYAAEGASAEDREAAARVLGEIEAALSSAR
jgi:hypothetical protein